MKKRRSVAVVAALFAVALSPTVAMGQLHLPSEPSTALPDESESAFEGSYNANLFTSEGGDVAAESVATVLEGEAQKMPEVEYDFIAGYFLDDSGNLIARKYADEANGDVRDGNGSKIEVLDSEYSKEDIDFIHSKLSELAKAPGSSGFIAEYDARKDLFVIAGKVDRGVAFQLLGDVKYSIVDGERVERFSRKNDSPPHWAGASIKSGTSKCTSGWAVTNGGSQRYQLTAAHCGAANSQWYSELGGHSFGWMVNRAPFPTFDLALLGGSSYGDALYGGPANGGSAMTIGGPGGSPGLGGNYCTSGAAAGERCGHSVVSLNSGFCDEYGYCTYVLTRLSNNGSRNGDSGGPFYGKVNGAALPRGIVVGGTETDLFAASWGRIKAAYPNLNIVR